MSTAIALQPQSSTAEEMYQRILELQPRFRERAEQCRTDRKVPDESIQELQDIGFFLALQPKRYGGLELTPQDFFRMQIAIAEACMSTAWASGIVAVHQYQIALMDDQAQKDVWSDESPLSHNGIHTRVSSSYAPMGKVEKVEGGFKFSGRWGWSSGSQHCTWALLGGVVPEEGYRTFLVPIEDYVIEDTWHPMGLHGTGSQDIVIEDCFVPEHRTHKMMDGFLMTNPGQVVNTSPLFQLPWAQLFIRVVSSPAIGAAKDALRLYKENALGGKHSADTSKQVTDISTIENVAIANNAIDEMETLLFRNFDELLDDAVNGRETPIERRAQFRYQASLVIEKSMQVVDRLFSVAGGRSVFVGSEIQQRFLDIHTARAHVANNPSNFARNYGSLQLGAENQDFFI